MKELNKQDMIDLLYGCTFLGTGGGGKIEHGFDIMKEDFEMNRTLMLADLDEIPDDAYITIPYGCGAPAAVGAELPPDLDRLPKVEASAVVAFQTLEKEIGHKFFAVSSSELGGMNTAEALHIACLLGIPLADGDPAGRSVPELSQSTFYLKGLRSDPMAVVTKFGEVMILKDMIDDFRIETLVRSIATVSGDDISVCDHPMTGKQYREAIIPGAISYALEIGQLLRKAQETNTSGLTVTAQIASKMGGKVLFHGTVTDMPWELRDGFQFGDIYLAGIDAYQGEEYQITFKNENIASYRNGSIDITVPDLICMIDKNGLPMTTPDFQIGDEMNVLALPAPEMWRCQKGLEVFGPRYFGIDADYVPFDQQ